MGDWALAVHGGSGQFTREGLGDGGDAAARAGIAAALAAGEAVLAAGGDALDAVEAAVVVLEDDASFNAGRGAVFAADGRHVLDACVQEGRARAAGAVAGVSATRNPVRLARAVMEHSPHVLLAGAGADAFSREQGLAQAGPEWFAIPERRAQLDRVLARGGGFDADLKYGTVGAVARDAAGHLAAATSTGGLTAKRWDRIGDSPIVGAGTLADDRACAVSATGTGEVFVRLSAVHEIAARIRLAGNTPADATAQVLDEVRSLGGHGGVIVVPRTGAPLWRFTTSGMFRGSVTADGARQVAIYADEA